MLDTNNRLNFGKALHPFDGYEMDYAIGTSYSLSLETLMFIPVTLLWGNELNTNEKVVTSELLEALTKVPEKVQLFCQRGKIIKPSFYHEILVFWEKSIEQIQMDTAFQSFHPKIWLIRYKNIKNKNDIKYRFLCTSRNLTLSKDWDLAVCMEGSVEKKKYIENKPLLDFIQMLNQKAKRNIKKEILDEIIHINFTLSDHQTAYHFHPIGFSGYMHPLFKEGILNEKLMVISPFLDEITIKQHRQKCGQFSLYSTNYELNHVDKSVLDGFPVYQFNPLLETAPIVEPEQTGTDKSSDENICGNVEPDSFDFASSLHAKCYVTENSEITNWFIGSANCSNAAKERNIEFLTEINFSRKKNTIAEIHNQLTTASIGEGLFVEFIPEKKESFENKKNEADLRKLIFNISSLEFKAEIEKSENQKYNLLLCLTISTFNIEENWEVGILPLSAFEEKEQKINSKTMSQSFVFKDFEEAKLTPFLLCKIYHDGLCCKQLVLELDIDFPADRMKKIFRSIICNQDRLFKYLNCVLSKEESYPLFELQNEKQTTISVNSNSNIEYIAIYEKLLKAASRNKSKIKLVEQTLSLLEGEKDDNNKLIVTEKFSKFFEVFKAFGEDEI